MFTNSHLEVPLSFPDICLAGQLTLNLIDESIISALALVQAFPVRKLGDAVAIANQYSKVFSRGIFGSLAPKSRRFRAR